MVEPGDTKVKSEGVEEKKVFKFKKKNRRNNISSKCLDRDVPELLKGVEYLMGRNGLDLYCIDNIQEWSGHMEMLETRKTDHLHDT